MSEQLHTYIECPVCHEQIRASRHTVEECRLVQERDEARRVARKYYWETRSEFDSTRRITTFDAELEEHPWLMEELPQIESENTLKESEN